MGKFKYFDLDEFLTSSKARQMSIENLPTFEVVSHIEELIRVILEPLRKEWGSGLTINSGFRCPNLNKAVGGSTTSAHLTGYAADVVPANGKIAEFMAFAEKWLKMNNVPFDQSIKEKDKKGNEWWHIGLKNNTGMQRRQYMSLTKK